MKLMKYITLALLALCFSLPGLAKEHRVLMLISSYGNEEHPDRTYDLEELAQSYLVLHDHGVTIDIASPKGGAVLVKDHKDHLEYIQRFKSLALDKLLNTQASASVRIEDYDGVFVIGGEGAMFDLPEDLATQEMLTQATQTDMVITAVCHGPAALASIRNADGSFYVANKTMNSFTNAEEYAFSAEHLDEFPFLLENRLRENGANFVHNAPMLPYVAMDGNLITAQNPGSVAQATEATLLAMGVELQPRTPFKDEFTMATISQARTTGTIVIDHAFTNHAEQLNIDFLALYGFYAYRIAEAEDKPTELALMETIRKYFSHPEYDTQLIFNYLDQGDIESAERLFMEFQTQFPNHANIEPLRGLIADAS